MSGIGNLGIRFLLGGAIVSAFSLLGHALGPKRFAGIFGAAPSVALASLGLSFAAHGPAYVATEARSMTLGTVAFAAYSALVAYALLKRNWSNVASTALGWSAWVLVAFALWFGAARPLSS